jgi:hypothetical protein
MDYLSLKMISNAQLPTFSLYRINWPKPTLEGTRGKASKPESASQSSIAKQKRTAKQQNKAVVD